MPQTTSTGTGLLRYHRSTFPAIATTIALNLYRTFYTGGDKKSDNELAEMLPRPHHIGQAIKLPYVEATADGLQLKIPEEYGDTDRETCLQQLADVEAATVDAQSCEEKYSNKYRGQATVPLTSCKSFIDKYCNFVWYDIIEGLLQKADDRTKIMWMRQFGGTTNGERKSNGPTNGQPQPQSRTVVRPNPNAGPMQNSPGSNLPREHSGTIINPFPRKDVGPSGFTTRDLTPPSPDPSHPPELCYANPPNTGLLDVLNLLMRTCPAIVRQPLHTIGARLHPKIASLIHQLGRSPVERGTTISGIHVDELDDNREFFIDEFRIPGKEVKDICRNVVMYHLPECTMDSSAKSFQSDTQLMCLVGDVYVMFDHELVPKRRGKRIVCVSIPGINFAYSPHDIELFLINDRINETAALKRAKIIMTQVFESMMHRTVQYPVLSAIGCGAFKGHHKGVPELYATAMLQLLSQHDYHFECVVICLPSFGDSNFNAFRKVFVEGKSQLKCPVLVIEHVSMVTAADWLADRGYRVGMLNPSDWQALRYGTIGMYWDGGHIALEEIIAMQTTLLFHHKGFVPKAHASPKLRCLQDSSGKFNTSQEEAPITPLSRKLENDDGVDWSR